MKSPFQKLDLNLLKVLLVLIEHRNTRKTAEVLHTSQPSISRALQKLRDHFNDELFIRNQYGLEPTARLQELQRELLPALKQLQIALEPEDDFDPLKITDTFTVAVNGFIANSFSDRLCMKLHAEAPNAKIKLLNWDKHTYAKLLANEVNLGINYYPLELSKQIYQKKIASDKFVAICRKGHFLAENKLEELKEETISLARLIVSDWNENLTFAEQALNAMGINNEVKVHSTYLHSILSLVKKTDIVFPCSMLFAKSLGDDYEVVTLPDNLWQPNGDIGLYISRQYRKQGNMQWLQQCVQDTFK